MSVLDSVPVIDIGVLLEDAPSVEAKRLAADEIRRACEDCGFFYVKNHGVPPAVTAGVFERARELFEDVETADKESLSVLKSPHFRGYIGEAELLDTCGDGAETSPTEVDRGGDVEGEAVGGATPASLEAGAGCFKRAKEFKQSFTVGAEEFALEGSEPAQDSANAATYTSPMHGPNQWPTVSMARRAGHAAEGDDCAHWPEWKADVLAYWEACMALSRALARGLALSLGLDEHFFAGALTHPCAQMVFLRYRNPLLALEGVAAGAGAETLSTLGCGAHTDCGFLTVLAQDAVGGLEVKHADGRWIDAPPVPGTFVVNLGDMAERWSGDRYKSTRHRVTYAKVKSVRYSVPFFCNCNFETPVEVLGGGTEYEPTTAGAYIMEKLGLMRV